MKMSGLLSRNNQELTGVVGSARLPRKGETLPRRMSEKDIAFVSLDSLSVEDATRMVESSVGHIVNVGAGGNRVPRAAYRILASAGVPVIEGVTSSDIARLGDGDRVRIDGGRVFLGEHELGEGREADAAALLDSNADAERELVDSALSHYADAVEFLHVEHSLLIDGEGMPELRLDFADQHVVVVSDGQGAAEELHSLKPFIREYRPILVGVDGGAGTLRDAGFRPDLVVGDAREMSEKALRDAGEIVLGADRDGRCPSAERITELELGAVTFPAAAPARDMAVLLAHHGGASMIVTAGETSGLSEQFAADGSSPTTSVVNMVVRDKIVPARACASLYRSRGGALALALLALVVLGVVAAALVFSDQTSAVMDWLVAQWNHFAVWVQGLMGK
ncbi:putative cytokinetic ring protein SteA [Dietzia sp.]|uniref:putative cytokinetic ring protein SteA n=1 Tax=Dietzia sp. TaxID=1871616 RepID=UPI002FD93816